MEVYLVEKDDLKRVKEVKLAREEHLEERLIRRESAEIGGVEVLYVGRQESPGDGGIFDLLGVDAEGNTVIIELKRDRAPRDIVAQALEYAGEIRNEDYAYLEERYREFCREHRAADPAIDLKEAHQTHFELDEPLNEREFNTDQRLVVVGTHFSDLSLNMADFLRERGIDIVVVEYATYRNDRDGTELLTTDAIRRPLSEEPASVTKSTSKAYPTYSEVLRRFRDLAYDEVATELNLQSPDDIDGVSGGRRLKINSKVDAHPDRVIYESLPRFEEDGEFSVRITIWNAPREVHQRAYDTLSDAVRRLDGFDLVDDETKSMGVINRTFETSHDPEEIDETDIEAWVKAFSEMINVCHPMLVEEFADF